MITHLSLLTQKMNIDEARGSNLSLLPPVSESCVKTNQIKISQAIINVIFQNVSLLQNLIFKFGPLLNIDLSQLLPRCSIICRFIPLRPSDSLYYSLYHPTISYEAVSLPSLFFQVSHMITLCPPCWLHFGDVPNAQLNAVIWGALMVKKN